MFVSNTSAFFSADFFNAKNRVFEKPFSQQAKLRQVANLKMLQYFEYYNRRLYSRKIRIRL